MKKYKTLKNLPNKRRAVCLGYFDGVHLGHKAVIDCAFLNKKDCECLTVLTFDSSLAYNKGNTLQLTLTNDSEKEKLLENLNVDEVVMLSFDEVRDLSCKEFVYRILKNSLNTQSVFCGFNYTFGKGKEGNADTLKMLCKECGINVYVVPPVFYKGESVSSTRIRKEIKFGNIIEANKMLGHSFSLYLPVVSGNRLGRKLGFPTMNQAFEDGMIIPKAGVYATAFTDLTGKKLCAVTNVGVRPTVGSDIPLCETWVPDIDLPDMYGKYARVDFLVYLRQEKKFESLDELRQTVMKNAEQAKQTFADYFKSECEMK